MTTSLAEQLKKLAVPQTSLLQRDKKRASLLFDPKKAAAIDKDTFYEIGINGFAELIKYNEDFNAFEATLFSPTSRKIERAVESREANEKLNNNIKRFLMLLSPYFLLKPAHNALEWLIYRFNIHEYNKEDLLKLIFPYHETNIFARCLQLFNFYASGDKWQWLRPLQKPGIHLPKTTLFNHAASDVGFLKFLSEMVSDAIEANGNKSTALTTLFSFYCTTIIGALEYSKEISESQISQILPSLLQGIKSDFPDFRASSYMIIAQLLKKTKLSKKILNKFVSKISEGDRKDYRMEDTLLLLLIYQSQNYEEIATEKFFKNLSYNCSNNWFLDNFGKLSDEGSYVFPLFISLLKVGLQNENIANNFCTDFVMKLIQNVRLDDDAAQIIIMICFDSCPSECTLEDKNIHFENFRKVMKLFEKIYPNPMDKVIREVMKDGTKFSKRRMALSCITKFLMVGDTGNFHSFSRLQDKNPRIRAEAVNYLIRNFSELTERDFYMFKILIVDRLLDDDKNVVYEMLKLNKEHFRRILGNEPLVATLIKVINHCNQGSEWVFVAEKAMDLLFIFEEYHEKYLKDIFLALLPYIFPASVKEYVLTLKILKSDSVDHFALMTMVRNKMAAALKITNIDEISGLNNKADLDKMPGLAKKAAKLCDLVFAIIAEIDCLPDMQSIISYVKEERTYKKEIHNFLSVILICCSLPFHDIAASLTALKRISPYFNVAQSINFTKHDSMQKCIQAAKMGTIPLEGLFYCLNVIILRTKPSSNYREWLNLTNPSSETIFMFRMLKLLLKKCNSNDDVAELYKEMLKKFMDKFLPNFENKIEFFANIITADHFPVLNINVEFQLRIIKILSSLYEKLEWTVELSSKIVVPALLIGLANPVKEIRISSLELVEKLSSFPKLDNTFVPLLIPLTKRKEEIIIDSEQLSLILYQILSKTAAQFKKMTNGLFAIASDSNLPPLLTSKLLNCLTFVNSNDILERTSKLGVRLLKSEKKEKLNRYESKALYNIILRFTEDTAKNIKLTFPPWEMISLALTQNIDVEYQEEKLSSSAVLILDQISREFFANLKFDVQKALIVLLAKIASETENPDIASAVNKVVKKIDLDVKLIVNELIEMRDVKSKKVEVPQRKFRRTSVIPTVDILDMTEWKIGLTVLEFIQDKKKLTNCNLLLPVLFGILKKCLDFDEQGSVEYPKQIILSSILHCCNKMESEGEALPETAFNMELVVQCIRASQNPQTHHHALLVLAHTASLIPEQVLHNIMAIFTFMGSSVLRHDDAYSFQIISKIIETVIPILVTKRKDENIEANVISVVRVFVAVILDVPEHRRMPLFTKLLTTLGIEEYLWLFLALVFEAHVNHGNDPKPKTNEGRLLANTESVPKRLNIATNIVLEFNPEVIIKTSIKLLEYLRELPTEKTDDMMDTDNDSLIFDIKQHTPKQFRHYKYTIVTFLSSLLSSKQLVNMFANLKDQDMLDMEPYYKNMIVNILTFIQTVSKIVERTTNTPQAQYWKVVLHHCFDIMDSINAILTPDMFLLVIRGLIVHNIPTVRRKAMELLNTKLQYQPSFFYSNPEDLEITKTDDLFALLPTLIGIVKTISKENGETEQELTQQTALLSLKLLVKLLAGKHPDKFTPILEFITDLIKSKQIDGNILASIVLCLSELCSKLRAHAIPGLVKFMPAIISVLKTQRMQETPGLLLMCTITAIQKIISSLPLFLSPYLKKVLCEITILSAKWTENDENKKITPFVTKLATIRSSIGNIIPPRVLIPVIGQTYETLLKKKHYSAIGPLMNILGENLGTFGAELISLLPDLTTFFLTALQFRTENSGIVSADDINIVEDHLINALTVLVLKLSETTFRPFYYRLFDWAVRSETRNERVVTFYRLSCGIAESLKGLFVLFAGHFVTNASSLLDACNKVKNDSLYFDDDKNNLLLVESILRTLKAVFLYDSQNFVNKDRFDALMQPLVDQLENILGGLDSLTKRANDLIVPCISQFAVATADDALWKQLNYQILLKARHNSPSVRLIALNCLYEVARKLGEDFLPLLPETIPFLAELLEDEDESVESACQKVVQDLEKVLGEPLKDYF